MDTAVRSHPSLRPTALLLVFAVVASLLAGFESSRAAGAASAIVASGPWAAERVSVGAGGTEPNGSSSGPSFSADGSTVGFLTDATNLTTAGGAHSPAVVVRNLLTDATEEVSIDGSGGGLAFPRDADLSGTGDRVVMTSVSGGERGIVLRDRVASTSTNVGPGIALSSPQIADAGDRVAFIQGDANPFDDDHRAQVWLADERPLAPGESREVVLSSFTGLDDQASVPVISGDGNVVAYQATVSGVRGVMVQDVTTRPIGDAEWYPGASSPALSADGRQLATLRYDDATRQPSVHVQDRLTGQARFVVGLPANGQSLDISADGSTVAYFVSYRNDAEEMQDEIRVTDVATGRTEAVSSIAGPELDLSADGRSVAFSTEADGVVPEDQNRMSDVFVARRTDSTAPTWPLGGALVADQTSSRMVSLRWPTAEDDSSIAGYLLEQDGVVVGDLPASPTSFRVTGLEPETTYTFAVTAVDSEGNTSVALTRTVTTASVSTEPGTAPLLATPGAGGSVLLQWDPATDAVDGYRVTRAEGTDPFEPVSDVLAGSVTEHLDTGLRAETTYRYQIEAIRGGEATPHSVEAEATTPGVTLDGTTWTGRGRLGTDVAIALTGAPGWTAEAEIELRTWYAEDGTLLAEPRVAVQTVPAAEQAGSPGLYRAAFPLVDGTSEVTRVTGVLTDGADHTVRREAVHAPLRVDGSLTVTIDAPEGSLAGSHLVVPNVGQLAVSGGTTIELPIVPAGVRTVQITSPRGQVLVEAMSSAVAGRHATLALTPRLPATIAPRILDEAGNPLAGALVSVLRNGSMLGSTSRTDSQGLVILDAEALAGESVEVHVTPPARRPFEALTEVIELHPGENLVELALAPLPTGTVEGTVSLQYGGPAVAARVVLDQQVDGRSWSFATETDEQGHYRIDGLAAAGTVTVTYRHDDPLTVPVDLTSPAALDIELPRPGRYDLDLRILTRTVEDQTWRGPLDLDWAMAVHLGMRIHAGSAVIPVNDELVTVNGQPGDPVEVCIDAREAGMAAACQNLVLGEDHQIPVEFRLESVAAARGRLVTGPAQPVGSDVLSQVGVARIQPDGTLQQISYYPVHDGAFDIPFAAAGRYRLTPVFSPSYFQQSIEVDVDAGDVVQLGDVVVGSSPWSAQSSLTANRRIILSGGRVELRAAVHRGAPGTTTNARARVTLPTGAVLVEGSVLLDGRPVAPTMVNGALEIPLPDRTFRAPLVDSQAYVLNYQLDVPDIAPGTELENQVSVIDGRNGPTILVASALVQVAGVTLSAPARTGDRVVPLSGWAPPGATVMVSDGPDSIGRALAGPGGLWSLATELPDLGNGTTHVLIATAEVDGEIVRSSPRPVLVDERVPELERVTLSRHGSEVSFDPREGVARFPFIYRGSEMQVTAEFGDQGAVEDVGARIGGYAAGAVQTGDRTWESTVYAGAPGLGQIAVDYTALPEIIGLEDEARPTADQIRRRLPASMADFGEPVIEVAPPTADTTSATMTAAMPGLGPDATVRSTLTMQRNVEYTQTAGDLVAIKRTGVQMSGATFTWSRQGDELHVTVAGYVPESVVQGVAPGAAPTSGPVASAIPLPPVRFVRVGFETAFAGAQTLDSVSTATGGLMDGDKYQRLNNLLDYVNANCDGFHANMHQRELLDLNERALANDATHAALMLAGVVLAPETFGIGTLAVWGATYFLDKQADYLMDGAISHLADQVKADCPREDDDQNDNDPTRPPEPPDDDDSVADPVWIHDPSGYVFEAVPSNRVEGVTANLLHSATADGPFLPWDAEWFGQINPLTTDAEGLYGWDVPEGFWQVLYTKDGYETARSDVLEVLPPHFDVNEGLVSRAAPEVREVTATGGDPSSLSVSFSRYMDLDVATGQRVTVTTADGTPVAGAIEPTDAEDGPAGRFARTFRFVPSMPFAEGQVLSVGVSDSARSYAGTPLAAPFLATVTTTAPPPPGVVAAGDELTVDEDTPGTIDLVANDSGGAGPLTVASVTQPTHGSAAIDPDGRVTYVPEPNWSGSDWFTYVATDGTASSQPVAVMVEVAPAPDAPVAAAIEGTGDEDTTLVLDPLAAATDADGDPLTVTVVGQPARGTAAVRADGKVEYRPAADVNGTDRFTFQVGDGTLVSETVDADVTITPVQDLPRSADDSATTESGQPVTIAVLANDVEPDGEAMTPAVVAAPAHGAVTVAADGTVTYAPAAGWSGTDRFTYQAVDPLGGRSPEATVVVTVTPKETGPTCTVVGTPGADVLRGTPGKDVICGLGGNDVIFGEGGDDILLGGAGTDFLFGGAGADTVDGGDGSDLVDGDDGNDVVLGGTGLDLLAGGKGDDRLDGGAGFDVIDGGTGRDGWKRGDQALALRTEYRF